MPIFKYRSVEEMPGETWYAPGDHALYVAVARLWATGRRLRPQRFPPGVTKHRTIEEMNRERERWDRRDR